MPLAPTSNPLITEVTRNETPAVVPTSPFARSRFCSGTRAVTIVGRAIVRRLPAIMPDMTSTTSAQRRRLVGSVNSARGVSRYSRNEAT